MKPTSHWAKFETKPDASRSASTPAIKWGTVHILVPSASGGKAGLVRACRLPQDLTRIQPGLAAEAGARPLPQIPLGSLANA